MPTYTQQPRRVHGSSSSVGTITKPHVKDIQSPITQAVTGIEYPSPSDPPSDMDPRRRGYGVRALYTHYNIASSAIDAQVEPPPDMSSLDRVWGTIRQEKERKMAKERPKVQSLEEAFDRSPDPSVHIPVIESQASGHKSLTKHKSISNFRESTDGRSMVATFEMPPEVGKQDIHLSFQRNRLVVTWETIEVSEWEEDGVVMRERLERMFHRTLPLPEGTRFEEIRAMMGDRRLILRYPNMRCYRVESRSKSGDS